MHSSSGIQDFVFTPDIASVTLNARLDISISDKKLVIIARVGGITYILLVNFTKII